MEYEWNQLERKIGYQFKNKEVLKRALLHSSYANEKHLKKHQCNERLEFLGDAVLELVSSEFLYLENEEMPEGSLTKTRASMVCEPALAYCAREMDLGKYLLLGRGEDATGGRDRDSIISDALEALIGAIYVDGGFASAKEFIHKYVLRDLEDKKLFYDSKSILQEMVQGTELEPVSYELLKEEGPDHQKSFQVAACINGKHCGIGKGKTKKAAEQEAAYHAILQLRGKRLKQV